jgi:hypothetical protein
MVSRAVTALFLFDANAVYSISVTPASETQVAWRDLMADQVSADSAAIAASTLASIRAVTEKNAPCDR